MSGQDDLHEGFVRRNWHDRVPEVLGSGLQAHNSDVPDSL